MTSRILSSVALAAAAAVMFSTAAISTARADEAKVKCAGVELLQGTLGLQERQQRLQGPEFLQGPGIPGDDARRIATPPRPKPK